MKPLKKASAVEANPVKKATRKKTKTESSASKAEKAPLPGSALAKVSQEQRADMIRTAAYFCAEQHGFQCDRSLDDWLSAEADIDSRMSAASEN